MEILEWKSTMAKIKNSLKGFNSTFVLAEEVISELEGSLINIYVI